jgi:class 3 adenylate cyclase
MTLPSGTVTFLFTDVEGSTRLLHELGAEEYAAALAEHRLPIREACSRHEGVEVDTRVLARSEALREEIGGVQYAWIAELNEGTLAIVRAELDEAALAEAWEDGRALTLDEAVALALAAVE